MRVTVREFFDGARVFVWSTVDAPVTVAPIFLFGSLPSR